MPSSAGPVRIGCCPANSQPKAAGGSLPPSKLPPARHRPGARSARRWINVTKFAPSAEVKRVPRRRASSRGAPRGALPGAILFSATCIYLHLVSLKRTPSVGLRAESLARSRDVVASSATQLVAAQGKTPVAWQPGSSIPDRSRTCNLRLRRPRLNRGLHCVDRTHRSQYCAHGIQTFLNLARTLTNSKIFLESQNQHAPSCRITIEQVAITATVHHPFVIDARKMPCAQPYDNRRAAAYAGSRAPDGRLTGLLTRSITNNSFPRKLLSQRT
jgi:hypothetical protein